MEPRIIVLDDQQYLREIIAAVLDDAGYPAIAVGTPAEALQRMRECQPAMLVVDMLLPGTSGLAFLDEIRATPEWRRLPVVMVSGDPGRLVAVEDLPNVITLTKPFDATLLVAAAARLVGPPALIASA
jgi:CheY-like chemotaxis protein